MSISKLQKDFSPIAEGEPERAPMLFVVVSIDVLNGVDRSHKSLKPFDNSSAVFQRFSSSSLITEKVDHHIEHSAIETPLKVLSVPFPKSTHTSV